MRVKYVCQEKEEEEEEEEEKKEEEMEEEKEYVSVKNNIRGILYHSSLHWSSLPGNKKSV